MKMTWRWYGEGNDSVTLAQIRQIPGVEGIVWSLHDLPAGAVWDYDRIQSVVNQCKSYGFSADVVESVNVHDDIKIGLPSRDRYIENYIDTIQKLARAGVKVICYNFMPVFDWTRTNLFEPLPDGSNALFYEKAKAECSFSQMIARILENSGSYTMPGWEPERLKNIEALFEAYRDVDEEKLTENCAYFLRAIMPTCEKYDVKMAIHADDPPWPIYGLPRILRSREHIDRFLKLANSPYSGLTLCTGALGSSAQNDVPAIIREFGDRIYFAHIRNVKRFENGDFIETSHRDGSLDLCEIVNAFLNVGFEGYVRPDHGRHIWGEEATCRPGYGMYDRALGVMYLLGLWDALERSRKKC